MKVVNSLFYRRLITGISLDLEELTVPAAQLTTVLVTVLPQAYYMELT